LSILPEGVKLFVDPICTDAGTAIGLAKLKYYSETKTIVPKPLKSLYLGIEK
jgi:carbamoyltransferase